MRLFPRYLVFILLISWVILKLLTRATDIQSSPADDVSHIYIENSRGEPIIADEEVIQFQRSQKNITYKASWDRQVRYVVQCHIESNMALDCASEVHYGLTAIPTNEQFVFLWEQ